MDAYWNPELETKPWPEVEAWQLERFDSFLSTLSARSAFYREKLAGIPLGSGSHGPASGLEGLPFTTKDELRRAQETARPGEPFGSQQAVALEEVIQAVSSSGTTGRPVYYGLTRRDWDRWCDGIANVFFTAGIRPQDVVAHLVGLPIVAGGLPYADGFRRVGATLAWLGGLPTERMLALLPHLQVSAILSTTSFGVYLTEHARDLLGREAHELGVRKLLGGGEPGLGQPEIRRKIEEGWRTHHVRETMGLGDVLASMWGECDEAGGMHFNAQRYVIVELVDPVRLERVPWAESATGEAVYTTFDRDATPVLRFRSADHMVVEGIGCACGRTSPKVRCVGRTDDMLIYKGMNVFPTAIRDVVLTGFTEAVEPYLRIWKERKDQVRFDTPIPLEVEARDDLARERYAALAERMEQAVRRQLQVRINVTLVPRRTLPRSAYKTPLVHIRGQDLLA